MKKKYFCFLLLSMTMMVLTGCKVMYIPNVENVPLLKEKMEFRGNFGLQNYQVAFAPTNHLGIMSNAYVRKRDWEPSMGDSSTYKYKYSTSNTLVEAGSGYFTKLGEDGIFESYAGGGGGSMFFDWTTFKNDSQIAHRQFKTNYTKVFIQPAIGLSMNNIDFAFSVRWTGIKFSTSDTLRYTNLALENMQINDLSKPFYSFIEPALTLRFGFKYVKFQMQTLLSLKTNKDPLFYFPFTQTFTLHINIAKRYFKK